MVEGGGFYYQTLLDYIHLNPARAGLDRRVVAEGMERAGVPALDAAVDARCSHLRRGWYWGSQEFGERMLEVGEELSGNVA